jgi:hypothetical protein
MRKKVIPFTNYVHCNSLLILDNVQLNMNEDLEPHTNSSHAFELESSGNQSSTNDMNSEYKLISTYSII